MCLDHHGGREGADDDTDLLASPSPWRWRVAGRPRGESATAVVLGGSESSFGGRALGTEEEVSMGLTPGAANAYRSPINDPSVRRTANTFSSASDERRMREGWKHGVGGGGEGG